MPKAILEFNIPEEREEYELASNAGSYSCAIWDFSEHLRRKYKHEGPPSDEAYKRVRRT